MGKRINRAARQHLIGCLNGATSVLREAHREREAAQRWTEYTASVGSLPVLTDRERALLAGPPPRLVAFVPDHRDPIEAHFAPLERAMRRGRVLPEGTP